MNETEFRALVESARTHDDLSSVPPASDILQLARTASRRRKAAISGIAGVVAIAVLVAAIGVFTGESDLEREPAISNQPPLSGDWKLVAGSAKGEKLQLIGDRPITLAVAINGDGRQIVRGQSVCNSYGADYTLEDTELTIGGVETTMAGCLTTDASRLETAYYRALGAITSYEQTETTLTLLGTDTELKFSRLPAVPTAEIIDTIWHLVAVGNGETQSSAIGDAIFQLRRDGTYIVTSGCGLELTGKWIESTGAVHFISGHATGGCQQNPQSQAIMSTTGNFYVSVDGDRMTVTGHGGGELFYTK